MPLTPKNRKEEWLQGLVDHETTLTPKNRPEEWMKEIIDASGSGGTGGGALIVTVNNDTGALDRTWQEIHDAALTSPVLLVNVEGDMVQIAYFDGTSIGGAGYAVTFVSLGISETLNAAASTKTGYPVMQM